MKPSRILRSDPKSLDAVKVDTKKNEVNVDLSRLYKGIDLPETLSNLTGKRIRRTQIVRSHVRFSGLHYSTISRHT
jgi:hypothetical protein